MVQQKSSAPLAARWDKIKSVKILADDISSKIKSADKDDEPITLDIGPQLLHTLRHPSSLRCLDHSSSKLGEMFTTHCNKGAVQIVKVWTLETKEKDGVIKHKTFETDCEITSMTYVSKHRAYLLFCSDLTLRVFTDSHSNFVEVQCIPCLTTTLCLIYNKEEDEIYAGGIGFIEEWKIQGAEHAAQVIPGRKFVTELTRHEWIRDIQVDKHKRQMFAVHGNGICVICTKTRHQIKKLSSRHDGPLKCCCYYYPSDFLVTGGSDGKLKLFNGTAFNLLHILTGHHGPITSVQPHKTDTLLFSSSLDGSVRIWRMDSLQMFMRLDLGEKIFHLSLIGTTEFFFATEKNVLIYSLNQFYQMFAPVESETKKLIRCGGRGKCSRILGSTEDGSVRLFSPVTGLTLTMVYPMPSFQVLMSFAYDMHQDKLHVVLTGGKVVVYDTSTNPCAVEELWVPAREDEQVNNLLLVTVEFMCTDGGLDIDNLVFAGLENGQIILCESVVCTLQNPVQAHEGNIVCLEKCYQMTHRNLCLLDTSNMILSGGTDNFVKLWFIDVNTENHRPLVNMVQLLKIYLVSVPTHISMFGCLLSVVIKACTEQGVRWSLIMYQLVSLDSETSVDKQVCNLINMASRIPYQLTHSPDEDHSMEITALDVCPIMGVILTAGKDGFVKVWNRKNELLREMNFVKPIHASCFANDRGDILVGYGSHVCSVSVVNYLPVSYLSKVLYIVQIARLQDDKRELPVGFDHNCQPWVDLSQVKTYSINIFERRRQHLEEDVIKRLKKEKEATKFVIFIDGGKTKVIAKDLADRLLFWAKGKHKLGIGKKVLSEFTSLSDITDDHKSTLAEKKKSEIRKKDGSVTLVEESEEKEYLDSQGLIEIYPSAVGKAIRSLENKPKRKLTLAEMRLLSEAELLKKDPIIAPDGYIPNSVIRRKLKPPKVDPPKRYERPFKLKPVPKVNPDHLPSWWGKDDDKEPTTPVRFRAMKWEDSPSPTSNISSVSTVSIKSYAGSPVKKYIEDKSKTTTPKSTISKETSGSKCSGKRSRNDKTPVENIQKMIKLNEKYGKKKSGWEDSTSSEKPDTTLGLSQPSTARDELHRSPSGSSTRLRSANRHKPGTPTSTYQSGSARSRISSTESVKSRRMELKRVDLGMSTPDRRRGKSDGKSIERTRSFKLTSLAVDEDSSMIHIKESKSGRALKNNLQSDIIQQLLGEKWMPKMEGSFEYEDVLDMLIGTLDNNNPVVYDNVCKYLTSIFQELGIPDSQLDSALAKLGMNLNNVNSALKKYTLQSLQVLGEGRNDIILLILPKLVDPEEPIRKAAADAISVLTGAHDKDTLFAILDEMGMTGGLYNSKEDEKLAIEMLSQRFDNRGEDPEYFARIEDWVQGTTPGHYSDEKEDDSSWQDGKRSRKSTKEFSFMSDGKSVLDIFDNSGPSGRNTMYADLPATPLFSSDDELGFGSRGTFALSSTLPPGRKDTQDMPRSGSTLKKKFHEMDGFSTISDRSSLSRKSKRSGRTPDSVASAQPDVQTQSPDAVSLRDILAYKSDDESSSLGERQTPSVQNVPNMDGGVSIRPATTDQAYDKDKEEFTESQFVHQFTTTDTTVTTDSHRDTYDNFTIDLLAQQNALVLYPTDTPEPDVEPEQDTTSDKNTVSDKHTELQETENASIEGSAVRDGNEEGLSLPAIKDVQVDASGGTDSVSPRFTPRDPNLFKYYNNLQGQTPNKHTGSNYEEDEDKLSGDKLGEKDSDFHSISNVASSQITDRLSGYDSGIARDMSEFSQGRSGHRKDHGTEKGYTYGAPLSPVKSETSSRGRHSARSVKSPREWRKFFDELPNAVERRQMEQIKKEMEQGKLKASTLPPISYFADDIPLLPGEAGTRLLQTVKVGEKLPHPSDLRHRIESVPGKLAVHTQNEAGGLSHFGILEMKWTTGVPTVRDKLQPPQRIAPYRSPVTKSQDSYLLSMAGLHRLKNEVSEEELNLPHLSAKSPGGSNGASPNHYEWEMPLPPPPAKESRTNIPNLKKEHDNYCKYYELVKKKLHLYTSQKRERSINLPEVLVKRIREEPTALVGSPGKLLSPSKTALGSQLFLPPIKLGQLVKMY